MQVITTTRQTRTDHMHAFFDATLDLSLFLSPRLLAAEEEDEQSAGACSMESRKAWLVPTIAPPTSMAWHLQLASRGSTPRLGAYQDTHMTCWLLVPSPMT